MNLEFKVKIKTEKIDLELTQEEAKNLYDQLGEFFDKKEMVYIPYPRIIAPNPWQEPYYIGDFPPIHVTFSDGSTKDD